MKWFGLYFCLFILVATSCTQEAGKERVGRIFLDSTAQKKPTLPTRTDAERAGKGFIEAEKRAKNTLPTPTRIDTAYSAQDSVNYALFTPIKSELWEILMDLKYDKEGVYGHIPHFQQKHKALHKKQVAIEGYMHALEATPLQKWFMLSYFPSSACFFCGAAGPETAIEVKCPKGAIFKQDKRIKLKGILHLNVDEPERLFYVLEEAELLN